MGMIQWTIFTNTASVSKSRLHVIASNLWFEIKRMKGVRPQPRYRHTAVVCNQSMIIFGGVDTSQQRFNDVFSYDIEKRKWTQVSTTG